MPQLKDFGDVIAERNATETAITLIPVCYGNDRRFYAGVGDTSMNFAVRGNTLVVLPFSALSDAPIPEILEPGSIYIEGESGDSYDSLTDMMNGVACLEPVPFERVVTEPKTLAVNWVDSEGTVNIATFQTLADATAFCIAHGAQIEPDAADAPF